MPVTGEKEPKRGGRTPNVHPNGRRVFKLETRRKASAGMAAARRSPGTRLPSWRELSNSVSGKTARKGQGFVETISTRQFVLLILVIAAAFTLYVGHVQATQDLLSQVQDARRENLRLHLRYNRLKGEFDYATSPAVIYERARALGLEEGFSYGATIQME